MKTYQSWLLGALACATIVPFTGCTKDEMDGPNGGNGEVYNTEFTVAFSRDKNSTKASDEEVGEGTNFNGMKDVKLLAFAGPTADNPYVEQNHTLNRENTINIPASNRESFVHKFNIALNEATVSFLFYGESAYQNAVGALTPSYTRNTAGETKFSLTKLEPVADPSEMELYIEGVVQAVKDNVKEENKTTFATFFSSSTSPALYQVAYMMAQLYMASDLYNNPENVKSAINKSSNPVFEDLTSSDSDITSIMSKIKAATNESYLGAGFPKGGRVMEISGFEDGGTVNVEIGADKPEQTYYKPTSLWYMANTYPVQYVETSSADDWITNHTSASFVDLKTHPSYTIALYDPIQYAVGQLDLKVKTENETIFGDTESDDAGITGTENFNAAINAKDIKLQGVLINNQSVVGWDFQALSEDNSTHIAYDHDGINNPENNTDYKTMKMLALPTKPGGEVELVLEMKNAGTTAFKGAEGVIPAGATFYVLAKLNPEGHTVSGVGTPAVFMSDYKTTVTLTLNSLKSAYNSVPDLSASNLEFALSVDLEWKQGIDFGVTIE